jgi:hypothetical protein
VARLRVTAKRPSPLSDLGIIDITNFNTAFDIDIFAQYDDQEPQLHEKVTFIPAITPPEPPIVEGKVLWDSNIDGKWNDGNKRVVLKSEGDIKPNGKGLWMAASGKPKLEIIGDGSSNLICEPGHGRFYVAACNFNSKLLFEFALSKETDNLSLKLRSRHQQGEACENRFGGYGCSISVDEVGCKREDCHNLHSNSKSKDLPERLKTDTWYKGAFSVFNSEDNKKVNYLAELDFNNGKGLIPVLTHSDPSPKAYMMNKDSFDKVSYFWMRQNNEEKATIRLRNVQLIEV